MRPGFSCLFLALSSCAATAAEAPSPGSAMTNPVRFPPPIAPTALPHRSATGRRATPMFLALQGVLPAKEAYDVEALSCVHVVMPNRDSTHCQVDKVDVTDNAKASSFMEAMELAGAQYDFGNKMPSFRIANVHATREAVAFDDAANTSNPNAPNARIEGGEMQDVMNALASVGITEDDGTLFVVCNVESSPPSEPACGYFRQYRARPKLDAAQSRALWNAFVHDRNMTVLNASHFTYDGKALSFFRVLSTVHAPAPPAPPPTP